MSGGTFTAKIPTPPSTNNLFVNGKHGRHKSKAYQAWLNEAGWELKSQKPIHFIGRVEIQLRVPRNNKRDLDNFAKGPLDLLVQHGVIQDDKYIERLFIFWHDIEEASGKAFLRVSAA